MKQSIGNFQNVLYEYIKERNKNNLENIALEYFDRKLTYKDLFDNIEKTAKAFTALGVKCGDIVVVITITTPETVYMLYALNLIGAIPNMVDPRTSIEGIKEYVNEVNARFIVSLGLAYPKVEKAIEGILKKHADGTVWIHTGDVGFVDEDGFINVCGRVKRLIIRYDGFKVFPMHIENVVLQHGFVENCCVVGMEDKQHMQGKLPVAFVVCNQKYEGDKEQLASKIATLCAEQLPEYAQPIDIRFVEKLPLTPIGKIDYRALEEIANG